MTLASRPTLPAAPDLQALFEALLFSVSHDLRSPLLTLSLSAELITDHLGGGLPPPPSNDTPSTLSVAMDGLRHGANDLERMLQALTVLSRTRHRSLDQGGARLQVILGGHVVISDEQDLGGRLVAVDPLLVREVLDAVAGDTPLEVHASIDQGYVILSTAVGEPVRSVVNTPLRALVESLQQYAGTPVEALAAAELLLHRQGGALTVSEGHLYVWLRLAERRTS